MFSYAVYIGILIFYFCFIFFIFPETKRLSAEDASRVFDYNRKGLPLEKSAKDVENGVASQDDEKLGSVSPVETKHRD